MGTVFIDMTVSLDGFVAGPGDDVERLHEWIFRESPAGPDRRGGTTFGGDPILRELFAGQGAVVIGRRTFDLGSPHWGEDPPFQVPCFVVTHERRAPEVRGATTMTFVGGVATAVDRAQEAAGGRTVGLMGASIDRQALEAHLVDEIRLHVVPVLLGAGIHLFDRLAAPVELEKTRVAESDDVTHLFFRVLGRPGAGTVGDRRTGRPERP